MIDDFGGPASNGPRKPKRIEPLEKIETKSVLELAAAEEAISPGMPETTEAGFTPPEAVAAADEAALDQENAADTTTNPPVSVVDGKKTLSPTRHSFLTPHWTIDKKWTAILGVLAVVLIGSAAYVAYQNQPRGQGGTFISKRPVFVPKETRVPSMLTGVLVDPAVNQRPVTGVMIENHLESRPQSGLDQAGVVFEAIAEGGITRFMALFQEAQPDYLGPVRSARPYYVQWCMSFDCALAHVGGSPEALQNIRDWGTKDLDQFYNAGAYERIGGRYAPHNVYTSLTRLNELETAKGYGAPSFTGFARKKDAPYKAPQPNKPATDPRRAVNTINLAISSASFNAQFGYDAAANAYARSQAGAPHMVVAKDGNQVQLKPKVVIALVTSYGIAYDGHSQYGVVGSGQAFIFQDGTVTEASWSKADIAAPLRFTDAAGADIQLNAGQTWITALGSAGQVSF